MIIKINWLPLAAEGILGSFGPLLGGVLVPNGPYCVIGLDEKTPLNPPQGVCSGFPKSRDGYHLGASLLGFGFEIFHCARLSPKAGGSSVLLPRGAWEHQRSWWVPSPLSSFFSFVPSPLVPVPSSVNDSLPGAVGSYKEIMSVKSVPCTGSLFSQCFCFPSVLGVIEYKHVTAFAPVECPSRPDLRGLPCLMTPLMSQASCWV